MIRVVVTGGRDYANASLVFETLDGLNNDGSVVELATGACPYGGADKHAEDWAKSREVEYRGYPARFSSEGPAAGPRRNRHMLMHFKPDLVVAFPGGRGTASCLHWARVADITIMQIED